MNNMVSEEIQYLDIIKDILDNGIWKEAAREGMPRTKEVFFRTMSFDMSDGSYPLFTTKKMAWKTCLAELTWFLKGDTNIKYLIENGCNIWTDDAYKWYLKLAKNKPVKMPKEEFIEAVNTYLYSLPERDCDVFVRRYFFAESTKDIAKRYDLKESNVLMILSRTRKKLQVYLMEEKLV